MTPAADRSEGTVLSTTQLNRALLARQHLLRRTRAALPRMLSDVGGLQMQYAPSGYIGCWTRMADFRRDRLTRALQRRQVVQATSLRATIHLLAPADHQVIGPTVRPFLQQWWATTARQRKLDPLDHAAVAAMVRGWFSDGPLTRSQLIERLAAEGVDKAHWEGLALWLDLLRVPPQGTWERRRAHLYGLADHEMGTAPEVTSEEGLQLLVTRYLGGFGPARVADLSSWAGVPAAAFQPVLERMSLRHFRDAEGRTLIDLPRRPIPEATVRAPVRFLPTWDATLLVHARRTEILPEEHRSAVFSNRNPHSVNTVLIDGQVAGTWTFTDGRVDVHPFDGIPRSARAEVQSEATRLAAFMA